MGLVEFCTEISGHDWSGPVRTLYSSTKMTVCSRIMAVTYIHYAVQCRVGVVVRHQFTRVTPEIVHQLMVLTQAFRYDDDSDGIVVLELALSRLTNTAVPVAVVAEDEEKGVLELKASICSRVTLFQKRFELLETK